MTETMPKWIERLVQWLALMPRARKRLLMLVADFLCIPIALWCAVTLRLGTVQHEIEGAAWLYAAAVLASVPVFVRFGLYRAVVRFIGTRALLVVIAGVTTSVVLLSIINLTVPAARLPLSAIVIYWAFALIYVGGSRFAVRALMNFRRTNGMQRVAVYGAGAAGAQLVTGLQRSDRFQPVAFVDDSTSMHRSIVNGIEVFPPTMLPDLIAEEGITTVLLALPSQNRRRRQQILKMLEPLGVRVLTVPDYGDILTGSARVDDIREVDASDLLGRDPVTPNERLLDGCIRDKVVMVTGAGGSIGSELCRQIVQLKPSRLVLLEMSEPSLYQIERELRSLAKESAVELVALLGNVHHRRRVRDIMQRYGVQTVYHAAAYKHVPIVEQNVIEGIHNNVFSTWYAAEAAIECHVETFVLISTDKAVNPTNVMGATKRMAELTLQALQERSTHTRFCMVRFGNVLESSGSVVPLFREQIKRGGPVTVTHKDVIRYFMTIPEASQLVLQAGSMAQGGDVFVLDMSEPVRIEDLARRMILLMGLSIRDEKNPEGDIEIVYTGLRPAEKLFEELLIGKNVMGTEHPMIMRATEPHLMWNRLRGVLDEMLVILDAFDCEKARALLMQTVDEYRPTTGLQDLVWLREQAAALTPANVASLEAHRQRQSRQQL